MIDNYTQKDGAGTLNISGGLLKNDVAYTNP